MLKVLCTILLNWIDICFQNIDRRKQKPGYNAYDEDENLDEFGPPQVKVLSKYDEEIEGEKKKSFTIGELTIDILLYLILVLSVKYRAESISPSTVN